MWDKLEEIERRYMELEESLAKPDVIANQELFQSLAKTYNELGDVVGIYRRYKQIDKEISDIKSLLDDPELGGMAEEELEKLEGEKESWKKNYVLNYFQKTIETRETS